MKYKVVVHRRTARYLKSLPEFQRQRIKQSLRELEVVGQEPRAPDTVLKGECAYGQTAQ